MTSTPETPGEGVPDDHGPEAPEPENGPEAAAPETGDDGGAADDSTARPAVEPADPEPEPAAAGASEPRPEPDGDDPEPDGVPVDSGDGPAGPAEREPEPADGPAEPEPTDAPAEQQAEPGDTGAEPGGRPAEPVDDGEQVPEPDDDRTQPDLSGEPAEPERHGGHVVLGGRYELGDVLGTGATFTVYEARPSEAGEVGDWSLVVKVLHPHLVDDEFSRTALRREVEASERVDDPGVVKVLATGEDDVAGAVVPWTVMRRFPGSLLSDTAAGGGLPWPTALEIVADVLDGLTAVHDAGLVHRDIAPRNVIVDRREDGTYGVGLLDLGLTAAGGGTGDGATVSGSIIGMSPEQAKGQPLDARSDLYSVGALTYYAITGHAPFERSAAQDVLRAHVEAPVPAVSARKPTVPGTVDRIVARAMAKNPVRRYPSAAEMARALRELLDAPGLRPVGFVGALGSAPSGDPTIDLAQVGSDPTENLDQVGGGTLRVGQLAEELGGGAHTTVVGAYVPAAADGAAAAAAFEAGQGPAAARGPVGPASIGPPPVDLPTEKEPVRRGRVVALVVALVLVLGGGGLALASLANSDWGRPAAGTVTREASKPEKPAPSPTESETEPEEEYVPPDPVTTPEPSSDPSTSAPSSQEPSIEPTEPTEEPTEPTEEPEPSTEPTDDASDPADEDTTPPPDGGDDGTGDDGTGGDGAGDGGEAGSDGGTGGSGTA
ncbi:hypothetical protein GCM10028784_10250 [Myceligenerans cantabricum]